LLNTLQSRFRNNCHGFIKENRFLISLFLFALLCDGVSTIYIMLEYGPGVEIHPAIQLVSKITGPVIGPLISVLAKGVAGMLVAIYLRRFAKYIFLTAAIISLWAAWYNVWGVELYYPNILKWIPW